MVQSDPGAQEIILRLATNERMKGVWTELLKKNRKSGTYFRAAVSKPELVYMTDAERQFTAIADLLRVTISAARDQLSVSKAEDVETSTTTLQQQSSWLRALAEDLEVFVLKGQVGIADDAASLKPQHLSALCHVADWLDGLAATLRGPDDSLTILNDRGDPHVRGLQILLADVCQDHFGERLDGTIATLASVATGLPTSKRSSRSRLSKSKSPKKAQSSKAKRRPSLQKSRRTE
jgi:hypothetical protein